MLHELQYDIFENIFGHFSVNRINTEKDCVLSTVY